MIALIPPSLKRGRACVLKDVFFHTIYFIVVTAFSESVEGARKVCFEWKLKDLSRAAKFYILRTSFKKGPRTHASRHDASKRV